MKDKLEKFITENRSAFDDLDPKPETWPKVASTLKPAWFSEVWIWRAAAVLLLGMVAFLWFNQPSSGTNAQLISEFTDTEKYYSDQILEKIKWIENFPENDLVQDRTLEIQRMEAMYEVLSDEFKQNPNATLKDAMILNMLVRIDILNQQLESLELVNGMRTALDSAVDKTQGNTFN